METTRPAPCVKCHQRKTIADGCRRTGNSVSREARVAMEGMEAHTGSCTAHRRPSEELGSTRMAHVKQTPLSHAIFQVRTEIGECSLQCFTSSTGKPTAGKIQRSFLADQVGETVMRNHLTSKVFLTTYSICSVLQETPFSGSTP